MNILFVSDNEIKGYGGGNVENRKHYDALKKYCEATGDTLKVISRDKDLTEILNIIVQKNKVIDSLTRLLGHSTFLYYTWFRNFNIIHDYCPDILYLGRSRFGFMAKHIKKKIHSCKVITNIDNVEVDYIDGYFALRSGIKNKVCKALESIAVKRDEGDAIKYSDCLIYLTQRNIRRIFEVYGHKEKTPVVVPICLATEQKLTLTTSKKTVVFIGSLNYAANVLAVEKILNIWKNNYSKDDTLNLLIAGRNPSIELISKIKEVKNTKLIQNFNSAKDIIPKKSLMLAPLDKGAGMKVKVAETLSMGLMIVASDEALVGYEDAEKCSSRGGIIRANSIDEYKDAIEKYMKLTEEQLECIEKENLSLFNRFYTYNVSRRKIKTVIDSVRSDKL